MQTLLGRRGRARFALRSRAPSARRRAELGFHAMFGTNLRHLCKPTRRRRKRRLAPRRNLDLPIEADEDDEEVEIGGGDNDKGTS